ncbi:MAG: creatininase family protein [Bacillota bacterium]
MYSKTGIRLFEEMSWKDVEDLLKLTDLCIIPVGAVEQHGPHLPLGSDTFIAQEMACRTCAVLKQKNIHACVGPSIPFGVHPEAMHYPGSVQIRPTTLVLLLKEVCAALYDMGFKKVVLLMGHDANIPPMQVAAQELQIDKEMDVMCVNWLLPHLADQKRILPTDCADGHGGARETARAMAAFPELVQLDKAVSFRVAPAAPKGVPFSSEPLFGGAVYRPMAKGSMKYYPDNCPGQLGDPNGATVEAGDELYDALAEYLAALFIQEYDLKPTE